ncbi:MAG: hypothetical protein IPF98_16935 [Gemmatimonadetes bacterium]|nr:hypothetical protein [Gemmatimonadota bacterium]MCC6774689.1 hypothetical protein [Gemmatimonadaceae bacterium]
MLDDVHDYIGLPRSVTASGLAYERTEVERRIQRYRDGRPVRRLAGCTVIVVDDGIASGATLRAAARALRRHRPAQRIAAVPVASNDGVREVAADFDAVLALRRRRSSGRSPTGTTTTTRWVMLGCALCWGVCRPRTPARPRRSRPVTSVR